VKDRFFAAVGMTRVLGLVYCAFAVLCAYGQTGTRQDALALEQQGRNAEAAEIWSSIAQHDPRNAEALAHLGLVEARQEHYGEAISYYRRALSVDPAFPSLRMNLGLALFKTDQFGDAAKAFMAELERHPGDLRLITLLGMTHYAMGDYLVAIPYLQKATESDPQNLALRMTLARSCLWSRQLDCVIRSTGEILAANPGSAEAAMLAGEALDAEANTRAAIERFRTAIGANPSQADAHLGLGYLYWRQGKYADATAEFQAELEADPTNADVRAYLSAVSARDKPAQPLILVMPNAQPPAQP
jgi:tetratricopeptide (TPR) repeat protein